VKADIKHAISASYGYLQIRFVRELRKLKGNGPMSNWSTLVGFTLPEPSAVGRKNWIRSTEVPKILDATGDDQDLKFALFCGFDAGST